MSRRVFLCFVLTFVLASSGVARAEDPRWATAGGFLALSGISTDHVPGVGAGAGGLVLRADLSLLTSAERSWRVGPVVAFDAGIGGQGGSLEGFAGPVWGTFRILLGGQGTFLVQDGLEFGARLYLQSILDTARKTRSNDDHFVVTGIARVGNIALELGTNLDRGSDTAPQGYLLASLKYLEGGKGLVYGFLNFERFTSATPGRQGIEGNFQSVQLTAGAGIGL